MSSSKEETHIKKNAYTAFFNVRSLVTTPQIPGINHDQSINHISVKNSTRDGLICAYLSNSSQTMLKKLRTQPGRVRIAALHLVGRADLLVAWKEQIEQNRTGILASFGRAYHVRFPDPYLGIVSINLHRAMSMFPIRYHVANQRVLALSKTDRRQFLQ